MWRQPTPDRRLRAGRRHTAIIVAAISLLAALAFVPTTRAAPPTCTAARGQSFIESGRFDRAIREFTCLIDAAPTEVEGYRGRAEASLLLGRFSDAYHDYYAGITAFVLPVHPDAVKTIYAGYATRLSSAPTSRSALTGASFARWVFFDYPQAIHLLDDLHALQPNDVYANVFGGSTRLLKGTATDEGIELLERAIELSPASADVHYVVADAYTYGLPDPQRAFDEASLALAAGLDTPRVHAILAFAEFAFGDDAAAASHIERHIELVTTDLRATAPLASDASLAVDLAPGRVYDFPVAAVAGGSITVSTSSHDFYDSIAVLLAPDGTPVTGSDDTNAYFAAIDWPVTTTGTYTFRVTSFEGVDTGLLTVRRD